MKTVLVTGGTGYIGAWVANYLVEEGTTVHITVRDKSKKEKFAHLIEIVKKSKGEIVVFEAVLLKKGSFACCR